jgi:hypothetical protein
MVAVLLCVGAALSLGACNQGNDGVGGVTVSEARALNEAAAMLDDRNNVTIVNDLSGNSAEHAQ